MVTRGTSEVYDSTPPAALSVVLTEEPALLAPCWDPSSAAMGWILATAGSASGLREGGGGAAGAHYIDQAYALYIGPARPARPWPSRSTR